MRNPGMPANIIEWIHIIYKGIPGYGGNSPFSTSPKAGIHLKMRDANSSTKEKWIPAFAGMTEYHL